ncbi:hypothetical protein BV22DRAFT_852823 [Leucogyrophana mollusca]|uniref:Uncharacterized protein n=1 Tax=Leucogyrophana mollusca TaxID=85980 RepID=A0ACB8B360_9AGAM|nr:hypothetical protein BV22DRAFT_852823 [Leucogyrophana mollusca]
MRLSATLLCASLLGGGLVSAHCSWADTTEHGYVVRVWGETNCNNQNASMYHEFHGGRFFGCECHDLPKALNDKVASFVFSGHSNIHEMSLYKNAGCHGERLGTSFEIQAFCVFLIWDPVQGVKGEDGWILMLTNIKSNSVQSMFVCTTPNVGHNMAAISSHRSAPCNNAL